MRIFKGDEKKDGNYGSNERAVGGDRSNDCGVVGPSIDDLPSNRNQETGLLLYTIEAGNKLLSLYASFAQGEINWFLRPSITVANGIVVQRIGREEKYCYVYDEKEKKWGDAFGGDSKSNIDEPLCDWLWRQRDKTGVALFPKDAMITPSEAGDAVKIPLPIAPLEDAVNPLLPHMAPLEDEEIGPEAKSDVSSVCVSVYP